MNLEIFSCIAYAFSALAVAAALLSAILCVCGRDYFAFSGAALLWSAAGSASGLILSLHGYTWLPDHIQSIKVATAIAAVGAIALLFMAWPRATPLRVQWACFNGRHDWVEVKRYRGYEYGLNKDRCKHCNGTREWLG